MNLERLKSAGINTDYGVKRFLGRTNLYEKTLVKFAKDTTFDRVSAAYEARDMSGLLASAHEFKGMCGNIGFTSLYNAADSLVRLLRAGAYTEGELSAAFYLLSGEYRSIHAAVLYAMEETI